MEELCRGKEDSTLERTKLTFNKREVYHCHFPANPKNNDSGQTHRL